MWKLHHLILNFFTHKDFLPSAEKIPGTLFSTLHLAVSVACVALIVGMILHCRKKSEGQLQRIYTVLWASSLSMELIKILWESTCGREVGIEWGGVLPLYPCSVFLYAMPFAIWGTGLVRRAACGYVCTLGLLGGAVNFIYPATVMNNYSCISFAGICTLFSHGVMVFCALTMLLTGYYRFSDTKKWWQLLLPSAPVLAVSVIANLVNYSPINADYMFFKMDSFIFAPLGAGIPDWLATVIVYGVYLLLHALPHLPFFIRNWADGRKGRVLR